MTKPDQAIYVYGIVPADVETEPDAHGVGDPPGEVTVVRHGDIAALVSRVATDHPLGRPEDLSAHAALLDGAAGEVPVLPMRFGSVVESTEQVDEELLGAHHDELADALRELEGKAQFVVRGRYREDAILAEILSENSELAQLRESIRGKPADATRNERIALGEAINNAIVAKRAADTKAAVDALTKLGATVVEKEPTHDEDAVHVATLVETARQPDLEDAMGKLADAWQDRVDLRLLGPLAAYDFVATRAPE